VRSRNLLKHLQDAHELMLESKVIEVAQPEERARIEEEVVDQLGGAEPDPAAWSAAERDLVEKLRLMEYGTWLEFDELDEKKGLRAKVAWFNPATSRYMLVDLGG